jgi:DNA mismatch repair protein MutS
VEQEMEGVKNYHIAAKKKKDDIIFLRKIVPGGADQSYGIEVAKLAGVPGRVIDRARDILRELEEQGKVSPTGNIQTKDDDQLSLGDLAGGEVLEILRNTAVETLTPIEAMNLLYQLKQKL